MLGCRSALVIACLLAACPAFAQFGPRQTDFRNLVKGFSGTLDIHGVGSGSVTGPAGSTTQYTTDQHVSGSLDLASFDTLTGSWVGRLNGTITIQEKSVVSLVCTITTTYTANTSAQTDFLGQPITWHLSLDIGSDTWSLWPDNSSVNGTVTSVTDCGGAQSTSTATNPLRFASQSSKMGFSFPATGYDLSGTGTVADPATGNTGGTPVTYTFTYNLKANTGQPRITIATNPTALTVVVDGATLTAPQTFNWDVNSSHSIGTTSPQGTGTLYAFDSWSDGGAQTHTITTPNQDTTYTARFNAQYLLTGVVNPAGAGTIEATPCCTNGYFDNGTPVSVKAVPACGFTFANWSSDLSGSANPDTITMNGPHTVTASFTGSASACTTQKTQITGPPPGSSLAGSSASFSWGAVTGAAGYYLQVGTYPGGGNIFSLNTGLNLSQLVNNIPLSCSSIYARISTLLNGVWQFADSTYKCASANNAAQMISPAPNSVLSSADVTFTWNSVTGAQGYWLDVGSFAAGFDVFSQSAGLSTSLAASLPADGSTFFVRLWTLIANAWQYNDYIYTASGPVGKAAMIIPTPGSILNAPSVTFTWSAGAGASSYWLDVGTTPGGFDLFSQSEALATSQTVANLPASDTIYVRLWTAQGSGWLFNDYTYQASSSRAVMITPAPGTALTASTVTFNWNPGNGASGYWVDVGTSQGGFDLFTQDAGLATSLTVGNLPANSNTLYVRLWTASGSTWQYNDYTYKASAGPVSAAITIPAPGTVLTGSAITFAWNGSPGAGGYWLDVGTAPGGFDLFSQSAGLATSQAVTNLPVNGSTIYVRLWTAIGGAWLFNDYTYTASH